LTGYQRHLEFSLQLKKKGQKIVQQDCKIAGPDDMVISKAKYVALIQDMKAMGKEVRQVMDENDLLKKSLKELQQEQRIHLENNEKKKEEVTDLGRRLREKILKL
jgi:hypothetical protein